MPSLSRAPRRHLLPVAESSIVVYDVVTMTKVNIREFKAHFSAFLDRVAAGETIVIAKRNEAIAEIRPIARRRTADVVFARPIEAFEVPDSFFEPLPDDLLAAFGEGEAP
jgi:prevent-host-death family protein